MTKPFVHPLFDLSSAYRLASQESVWFDHGERSIKRYFLALHRQMLREGWGSTSPPEKPQDWRFSPPVNALLHEYLRRSCEDAQRAADHDEEGRRVAEESARIAEEASAGIQAGADEKFARAPALLIFDLSQPGKPTAPSPYRPEPGEPPSQWLGSFTGIGEHSRALRPKSDVFKIDVPHQKDGRWCLALLLPLRLVRELATLLGTNSAWDDHDEPSAVDTICDVFDPERLARPGEDASVERFEAACRLGSLMALAAGWEQVVTRGRFGVEVPLGGPCPAIPSGTLVAFCKGPRVEREGAAP